MPAIINPKLESLEIYLSHFLPENHNEQDVIYLNERYKWETIREYTYHSVHAAYKGTTFEKIRNSKQNENT